MKVYLTYIDVVLYTILCDSTMYLSTVKYFKLLFQYIFFNNGSSGEN